MALNIYKFIHKTIRGQICQLVIQAGKTTYHDPMQVSALHLAIVKLASFLTNHANREDTFVHPALKEKSFPPLPAVEAEHRAIDAQFKKIVSQISKIKDAVETKESTADPLEDKGYDLYLSLGDFSASYLSHMSTEERKIMPFLWSNFSPDAIFSIFAGMQSTLTNQEIIDTIPIMYPYLNREESVKLTRMLMNEENFVTMEIEIKRSLEPDECIEVFKLVGFAD